MHAELLQSIRQAFPDDGVPGRPVTSHRCLECNEVDALLGGRTWSDVAADFPSYCHDAFPLLTQAAQIYYLPAYMIAAFAADSGIQGDSVESALLSDDLPKAAFSVPQRSVI